MRLAVVILQHGKPELTLSCLNSIAIQKQKHLNIVIIENGHRDSFLRLCRELNCFLIPKLFKGLEVWKNDEGIFIIYNEENSGYAAGNNIGISYSFGELLSDYTWILNNDTLLKEDAISTQINFLEENTDCHICGHTILQDNYKTVQCYAGASYQPITATGKSLGNGLNHKKYANPPRNKIESALDYISGASFVISRELYHKIGGFCEDNFLYFEEIELAHKCKRAGLKLYWSPLTEVEHFEKGSTGKFSTFAEYHITISSLKTTKKLFPHLLPFVIIIRSAFKIGKFLKVGKIDMVHAHLRGVIDFFKINAREINGLRNFLIHINRLITCTVCFFSCNESKKKGVTGQ